MMLIIRKEQMAVFEAGALRNFEDEMVLHSKSFTPELCKVLGDEQLRVALRQAMARATRYGFTNRGPMRLYIELMFLCGSEFDSDPLYPDIGRVLRDPSEQMQRADKIYQVMLDFRANVPGPGNYHVHMALERLAELARKPLSLTENDFVTGMLAMLRWAYPQLVAYTGEEPVIELIHLSRARALEHDFSAIRAQAMVGILMFAFGKGCLNDPLYPWIANTLKDERIMDAAARAARLERRALIWLDHVIEDNRKGRGA
jgi:hypothetical protein